MAISCKDQFTVTVTCFECMVVFESLLHNIVVAMIDLKNPKASLLELLTICIVAGCVAASLTAFHFLAVHF